MKIKVASAVLAVSILFSGWLYWAVTLKLSKCLHQMNGSQPW